MSRLLPEFMNIQLQIISNEPKKKKKEGWGSIHINEKRLAHKWQTILLCKEATHK